MSPMLDPGVVCENAWAKINLALHVTGKRDDGLHLLDSLVVFAKAADVVTVSKAGTTSLTIAGAHAAAIAGEPDNLVLKAAYALQESAALRGQEPGNAAISLQKNLPVAAGIGGGSADAAATLRALNQLWNLELTLQELELIGAGLGADVAACVGARACHMSGIGERVTAVTADRIPVFSMVLVNPGTGVLTADVFAALNKSDDAGLPALPEEASLPLWLAWLKETRNDLFEPAVTVCPDILQVVGALEKSGALLARMSGSGATCFGLFENGEQSSAAANTIAVAHPNWWVVTTETL
uniref:4-(cytidine 5'-diphospho)-2-C-methyl-D-erythritol kinase n=1 Tax=Pararhizobium sp. IMCC3301 TaxID=3067904 RepID=UPI002741637E|nr:4-(cytidine 5'-diphospho)-2-C-methyl-D-erythritol kinase [Pararhizobium sp. IMCC3301]